MSRAVGSDARVGSELAGYRIVGLLGRGATSTVYRAVETRLQRQVALKVLSSEPGDRRFERRFLRESKIAASLQHPNVIPIYSAGEADGQLYIAMRVIEGSDLKALLRDRGRLHSQRTIALGAHLAAALDAAHAHGLVHRDVKPSNVLLEQDSEGEEHVYLADFGLTKAATAASASTRTGELVGTIDYMAPEQIRGEEVDGRADLYSLGCLLYECLVGEPPFARGSEVATLYAQLHEQAPAASDRLPVLPKAIDDVFARALAKDPSDRYTTGAELIAAARTALGLPEHATRPWKRRRPRRTVIAVVCAAVAAAAVGIALAVGGSDRTTAAPIHSRVTLPGYRVTASERITSGAPGAYPIVGLTAAVDTGKGPVAGNLSRRPTGELVFHFDSGQIDGGGGNAFGAAPGSVLGYLVDWSSTGGTFVQLPVRKSGLTDGEVVHATIELPSEWRRFGPTVPLTFRETADELIATLNLQEVVRKIHAAGADTRSAKYVGLYLIGSARNPFEKTRFHASVSARPCADPSCRRLGPAASDAIALTLPEDLSVSAPGPAFYGQPATFTGTGVPGRWIAVAYTGLPGPEPDCTPSKIEPHRCGPKLAPSWVGDDLVRTIVRGDGTWSLAVPLTQSFGDGFGPSGRYSALEGSDDSLKGGPLFSCTSCVIQEASADTVVRLAKPVLTIRRQGRQLAVGISVKGGDSLVRYRLRWRGREVASGRLTSGGTAADVIPSPSESGAFQVSVSAPGTSASASVPFRWAVATHTRSVLPGYRVTLRERVSDGAPGAHPTVSLLAEIDNGKGPPEATEAKRPSGKLAFRFDRRQFEDDEPLDLPDGARFGYHVDSGIGTFIQMPVTKTGLETDPVTGVTVARGALAVPPEFAREVGKSVPLTIGTTRSEVVVTLDMRRVIRKLRAAGTLFNYVYAGVSLLGRAVSRQFTFPTTINPSVPTSFHASVSAWPCLDVRCTALGRPASDAITIVLPKELSVRAPVHATYGQRTTFAGTGVPGETVAVARFVRPGEAPPCTPSNSESGRCAPAYGPGFDGTDGSNTTVGPDGTWSLTLPLPSRELRGSSFGLSGRYGVAEYSDTSLERGTVLFGGADSVFAQAPADTTVKLAKPVLRLRARGDKLSLSVSVPGADNLVRFVLRSQGRQISAGPLSPDGTALLTIPAPRNQVRFQITVSRPGVESAASSAIFHR